MTEERWMPIEGWEGLYDISDMGRVRSLRSEIIMKPHALKTGHCNARLTRGGKTTEKLVHRLVLAAFVGPCPEGMEGCHNDGNPGNNCVSNLRWDSHLENQRDILRHGRHFWRNKTHCKYGHEFTSENTRLDPRSDGGTKRTCRECERRRSIPKNARRDERKRAARPVLTCWVCGDTFQNAIPRTKFCSPACLKVSRRVAFKTARRLAA